MEEEVNRHFSDAHEGKGFKGGLMYDIQEGVFQFSAKSIPIPGIGDDDGSRLIIIEKHSRQQNESRRMARRDLPFTH